jgi:serine phosphatase RsbU (regulator of sigma subunit)
MADTDDTATDRTMILGPFSLAEPEAALAHFLVFTEEGQTRRVRIDPPGINIGRVAPNEVVINSPQVSRRHCRIDLHGDWAVVADLNSTNGTFLEGERLTRPTRIRSGTRLGLGSFTVTYERRDPRDITREDELTADLARAEAYVRAILPAPLTTGAVRAEWCFVPSAGLGGDALGYHALSADLFTGFLLDVSGHGIGSCMHAANVANTLRRQALPDVDFADPAQVAAGLNRVFPMEEHNGLMLTLWYFALHLPSRTLRYCAAGHHAAYLQAPGAAPVPLYARGPAIGMMETGRWAVGETTVPEGATLTLFSDGAFEIVTAEGGQWDMATFCALLTGPQDTSPEALYQAVRAAARSGPLDDDVSIVQFQIP